MRQRPKLIDRGNRSESESLAFAKVRKLEKRLANLETTVDSQGFALFHPNGRVSEVENLSLRADRVNASVELTKNRLNPLIFTTNLCLAVILLSVTAMVARTAFDFVTMPVGAAVEVTGNDL